MILVPALLRGKSIRNTTPGMYFSHRYFIDHPVLLYIALVTTCLTNVMFMQKKKSGILLSPNQNFCTAHCLGKSDQRTCPDDYKVRLIDVSVHPHGPPSGLGIKAYTGTSATQKERRPGPDFCRGEGEIFLSLLLQASKKWLFSEIFWETQKWVLTQFGSVNLFELRVCVFLRAIFFKIWILWYFSPCEGFLNPLTHLSVEKPTSNNVGASGRRSSTWSDNKGRFKKNCPHFFQRVSMKYLQKIPTGTHPPKKR